MKLPSFWINVKWSSPAPLILSPRGMKPPHPVFWVNAEWSFPHSQLTRNEAPLSLNNSDEAPLILRKMNLSSFWVNTDKVPLILSQREMKIPSFWVNEEWTPLPPHILSQIGMKLLPLWVNREWSYPHSEPTRNKSEWHYAVFEATWNVFLWCWHKFKYSDSIYVVLLS